MANKRMFTMKIVDSDAFLDMPMSAQCLYFHLCMRADDDGFIGNPKKIMRIVGGSEDDLKILLAKSFLLIFENGVIVIKHWRMHNTLSSGRYHETSYIDEKTQLLLKDNGAYSFTGGTPIDDTRQIEMGKRQSRRTIDEQVTDADLDLDLDIDIEEDIHTKKVFKVNERPYKEDVLTFFHNRGLTEEAEDFWQMLEKNGWKTKSGEPIREWKGIATNYIKQIKGLRDKKTEEEDLLDEIYGVSNDID